MGSILNTTGVWVMAAPVVAALAVVASACGASSAPDDSTFDVVVTTNILGDVVSQAFSDVPGVDIEVIMGIGADPHDFAPSARQAEAMERADLLVMNGAGFEAGMASVLDAVIGSGTDVFVFTDVIDTLEVAGDGVDPHFWTDPRRMAAGLEALSARVADSVPGAAVSFDSYLASLNTLDVEVEQLVASVPPDDRVLVTNHEVFGYFADRYGFEVVGAVIASITTGADASSSQLDDLAELIDDRSIPAVFAETTQSTQLAEALADEVAGDVVVVELFSESLGAADSMAPTYVDMIRFNASAIAQALG